MERERVIELVCAVKNGEDSAATELYNAFQKDLYYHILKTVNDATLAEDLLQDTFIEIFQTIDNLQEPAAFLMWSKQIAYHRCTAYFKKRRDLIADENEDGYSIFDTLEEENAEFIPDEALDRADLKQTILKMIDELPEEQRSALLLRYFDEISVKEIAEIQGVTEGTVKSRLNYGRKAIKEAVEDYEKENGTKLHCAGVVPLLLWLFKDMSISNGASLTSSAVSSTFTSAEVTSVAVEGVKATGKFAVKKIIAGAIATTVAAGGITAACLLKSEPDPMIWSGYGVDLNTYTRRIEITVDEMNDTSITGFLEASYLYDISNDTAFTGTGVKKDDDVVYTLTFEEPIKIGNLIISSEYEQLEMIYDKSEDEFSMDDCYRVNMKRHTNKKSKVLLENESWSGMGEDGFYVATQVKDHKFDLNVYKMSEKEISGDMTVSYNDKIDHSSKFTGRGYKKDDIIHFEIRLETPRTEEYIWGDATIECFWLEYDTKKQTFEIPFGTHYQVVMEK